MNPHYCLLILYLLNVDTVVFFAAYEHVQDTAVYCTGLLFWAPALRERLRTVNSH